MDADHDGVTVALAEGRPRAERLAGRVAVPPDGRGLHQVGVEQVLEWSHEHLVLLDRREQIEFLDGSIRGPVGARLAGIEAAATVGVARWRVLRLAVVIGVYGRTEHGDADHLVGVGRKRQGLHERCQRELRDLAELSGLSEADEVGEDVGVNGRNGFGVGTHRPRTGVDEDGSNDEWWAVQPVLG